MDDSKVSFIDLPEAFFPIHIKWTDVETGETVKEIQIDGPGIVGEGGFGIGRLLRMDLKLGSGEEMVVISDGRV